jgi:hypothetical protein
LNANCKGNYLKYQVIIWRRIVDKKSSDKYEVIGSADKSDITIDCNPALTEKEIIYYDKDDNIVEIFTFF